MQTGTDTEIQVRSIVSANSGQPLVEFSWGENRGVITTTEARIHALEIFEAAVAAEMDAALFGWVKEKLRMSLEEAALLRRLFREMRTSEPAPSCNMVLGEEEGETLTSAEGRSAALDILFMALNSELEAFLAVFLVQHIRCNADQASAVIEELRERRGLKSTRF